MMLLLSDTNIRLATKDDLPFIADSWCKAMYHTYPNQYVLDFVPKFHKQIAGILQNASCVVSCLDTDPNAIVSYLIYTSFMGNLVVYYAYTKVEERKNGFLNQLLEFANPDNRPTIFVYPAKNERIMQHFAQKFIYDPYLTTIGA